MITHLDRTSLPVHVQAPGIAIVNWSSDDRAASVLFDELFERVAEANSDVRFGSVDIKGEPRLAKEWSVDRGPCVMVFRDGTLLFVHGGALDAAELEGLIRAAWAVDMDVARSGVDGQRGHAIPAALADTIVELGADGGAKAAS